MLLLYLSKNNIHNYIGNGFNDQNTDHAIRTFNRVKKGERKYENQEENGKKGKGNCSRIKPNK